MTFSIQDCRADSDINLDGILQEAEEKVEKMMFGMMKLFGMTRCLSKK